MKLSFFIASRLNKHEHSAFAAFISRLAIGSVGLSLAVMIITSSLILGFKNQIKSKVFDFWGHIHLNAPEYSQAVEPKPMAISQDILDSLLAVDQVPFIKERTYFGDKIYLGHSTSHTKGGVNHVQGFVQIPGILTVKNQIEGLVLKGVTQAFDTSFIKKYLIDGIGSLKSDSLYRPLLISKSTANRLELQTGKEIVVYFVIGGKQVGRKFTVAGIYKTGLEEYDRKFALCDAAILQQLLMWDQSQFSGYELFVDHIDDLDRLNSYIYNEILPDDIYSSSIRNKFPGIFEWLQLQDYNEVVILGLMIAVCLINMATVLIILILTRMKMIGILKTLGMRNKPIRRIFLIQAFRIILFGLLWGNIAGLGLAWLQYKYKLIKLNEADYYLSIAPIEFSLNNIVLINVFTVAIVMLFLIVPSWLVAKINPVRSITFN